MNTEWRALRRRMLAAGTVTSALYSAMPVMLLLSREANIPFSLHTVLAILYGMLLAFLAGAMAFGLLPHLIGTLMNRSSSFFGLLNHAAMFVALMSVAIGVISALMMVFGAKEGATALAVSTILFVGASAVMCTLKFFHANRDRE